MKVGIIQPSYIPWKGYFDFIDDVDLFIFLDDVQYTRRDWRNRNKINSSEGLCWLSVPVCFSRNDNNTDIKDVRIDNSKDWRKKHINTITRSYQNAPYFDKYADHIFGVIGSEHTMISELTIDLTHCLMGALGISTETMKASDFNLGYTKDEHLIQILLNVGATSYLSGPSAKNYINPVLFEEKGIDLEYKSYCYPEYPQRYQPFEHGVSVLDLLFNNGPESRKYLKSMKKNEVVP